MTIYDLKKQTRALISTLNRSKTIQNREQLVRKLQKFLLTLGKYNEIDTPKVWLLYAMHIWEKHIENLKIKRI